MRIKSPFVMGLFLAVGISAVVQTVKFVKYTFFKSSLQEDQKPSLLELGFVPHLSKTQTPAIGFLIEQKDQETKTFAQASLENYKGKPVILHFWGTWCGPCVEELPHFDAFVKDHQEDYHIIALTTERPEKGKPKGPQGESISTFYKEHSLENLSVNLDPNMNLTRAFQITGMPTTIFLDSNGNELGRIAGIIDWKGLAGEVIVDFLKGK